MIYLATVYSHPDPCIMESRFIAACKIAGALMRQGHHVFSPIAHTHPIAIHSDLPKEWDFWEQYDLEMIKACEALWVVKMGEWFQSRGIRGELRIAEGLHKPIRYIEPEEFMPWLE
jgi:hypothetical protein